jgi:hypothetical protein
MSSGPKNHTSTLLDGAEIENLVRDELDRRDKYLEFAQGQMEKDRSYFNSLYKTAAGVIALIFAIAGFLQYKTVSDMRTEMRVAVNDELERDKTEMAALRVQVAKTGAEVQDTAKQELVNVRAEVQKRINDEFQSKNISSLVANAAKEHTGNELNRVIRADVAAQVANSVEEQRPFIQTIVESKTKEAVMALQPIIGAAVDKATQKQVNDSVIPIQKQMATYGELIQIGTFVTLARSDNRKAFDYLIQVADGDKPESANPDVRNLAQSTTQSIISEKIDGLQTGQSVEENQTPETIKKLIFSTIAIEREASLDNYPQDDNSVLPILVDLIKSDSSITVLYKAVVKFNKITKQSFKFWQEKVILNWWENNRTSFK